MTEEQIQYIVHIHEKMDRQGPGSDEETRKALEITGLDKHQHLEILDLGCGTGAQTRVLNENLNGSIHAFDIFEKFLNELKTRLPFPNVKPKLNPMEELPFMYDSLDLIWAEGAIYNMGFQNGLNYLRPFLRTGGFIGLSEITWLSEERPKEIEDYWKQEYPEIGTINEKIKTIEDCGYELKGHFILSENSWIENYYSPLAIKIHQDLDSNILSDAQLEVAHSYLNEIKTYNKFKSYFGYGFYIAQKL